MDFSITPLQNPTYQLAEISIFDSRPSEILSKNQGITKSFDRDFGFNYSIPQRGLSAPAGLTQGLSSGAAQPRVIRVQSSEAPESSVDRIARQRAKLLAIKYAGSNAATQEVLARLDIMEARLEEASPRVTHAQLAALETAQETLTQLKAKREERARRLGL